MARRTFDSKATGETFFFDDAWNDEAGRVRRLEYRLEPGRSVPDHFHPGVAQSFEVISGALTITVNGRSRTLEAGEQAFMQPGDRHTQSNRGTEPVLAIEGYDPPIDIEPFFAVLPHAIASGNPLKMGVFFADFRHVNVGVSPAVRLLTAIMAPIGRLAGLAGWYRPLLVSRQG